LPLPISNAATATITNLVGLARFISCFRILFFTPRGLARRRADVHQSHAGKYAVAAAAQPWSDKHRETLSSQCFDYAHK
jgi:hypothetical protein